MVAVEQLGKRFGKRWILRQISFELKAGDSLIVTGPNGSGKSTLLKIIAGLLLPSTGTVHLPEGDLRRVLGYSSLDLQLYPHLTVLEHLQFAAEMRGCDVRELELLDRVGLSDAIDKPAASLSTGMRSRLKLALAVQSNPSVLLLDEPGASLDEPGRQILEALCSEHRASGVTIIATNDRSERSLGNLILELG